MQSCADTERPGEKTGKEQSWKGNLWPRVHHLTCLQHPEQLGQSYSLLCQHQQPWGGCRACLLLLLSVCSEQSQGAAFPSLPPLGSL